MLDLLDPAATPVWVQERSASKSLVPWDILGTRLARREDTWMLTGALYLFDRQEGLDCRDRIRTTIDSHRPTNQDWRKLISTAIADAWLKGLVTDQDERIPEAVVELLKSIKQLEVRRAKQAGGTPFDVSFLWQRLRLARPSSLV